MFAFNVAALRADAERWRDGEIRQGVAFAHRFNKFLHRVQIFNAFSGENMLHRAARVFRLDRALQI